MREYRKSGSVEGVMGNHQFLLRLSVVVKHCITDAERPRSPAGASNASPVWCTVELGCIAANCILQGMTRALDTAIAKLSELPAEEQDRIARWLLDELEDEKQWARRFGTSQDALSKLAAEARADRAAGRATELDPDKL